ncbi:hypothetical protein [Paludibaculum fermentans]|uniref:FecR protein domain-containing protein n=1 Tax=Paludibaculum fermentans TaxID=1473598 RepID=A0A7S7NK77_PALFE|nr:hypothetical protein [Paludibaculum fermentans]QOY85084.1 hypothetical protein IRI77_19790 [Paludibaculum fermentans]
MRNWAVLVLLSAAAVIAQAAAPVATASSGEDFSLKGAAAPVAGVPSYPVMAGDEIQAGSASTVLKFKDGSTVTLAPHARARVEDGGSQVAVRLLSGGGTYSFSQAGFVQLYAGSKSVPTPGSTGQFALESARVSTPSARIAEPSLVTPPAISRRR